MRKLIPVVLLIVLTGCGTSLNVFRRSSADQFKEAKAIATREVKDYTTAAAEGQKLCQSGALTTVDCARLTVAEEEWRAAYKPASDLLKAWTLLGGKRSDRPKGYKEAAEARKAALDKVIAVLPVPKEEE